MRVGDDELNALQAASDEVLEEGRPEWLGLAGADMQADDLALALGVDRDRYYRGDTDDAAALANLEVSGHLHQPRHWDGS